MPINSREKGARNKKGQFLPEKNIYRTNGDIVECYSKENTLLFYTNKSNFKMLRKYNWSRFGNGYSMGIKNGEHVILHRYLTNCTDDSKVVDHINQNKKDNRIENLRICGRSTNAYNSKNNINNTSGIKGVWFRKDTKKWAAEIKYHYRKICLGCFADKNEAINARKMAEWQISNGKGDELCAYK